MSAREIKDLTLDLARAGDRLEAMFVERSIIAQKRYATLINSKKEAAKTMPLLVRVTAIPTSPQNIPNITIRPDLWWSGKRFSMKVDDETFECDYPVRDWTEPPQIRLRSLVTEESLDFDCTHRLVRSDGLVDFSLLHPKRAEIVGSSDSRVYFGWIISLVAGVIAQVDHLRARMA